MSAPYLVTGVATQDVYPRLEIRDLHENHPKQFTLFVRGWQEIRRRDYRPIAAQYEQIAGIHGMPYVPWPGDPDEAVQTVRGAWLGYCNHASIMFPTWHRPCIMLLEQAISEAAHGIAGTYAKRHPGEADEWINAARELRFPYWDWTDKATGQEGLPKILTDHKISIHVPDGKTEEVENVLAFYKFNNQIDGFNDRLEYKNIYEARRKDPNKKPDTMAYFKQWDRTYRWPNSSPVDVTEDIQALNDELKAQGVPFPVGSWANLRSDVASLFGYPIDVRPELHANVWDQFSNTRFQSSRPDVDHEKKNHSPFKWEHCASIEQPHNNVHLVVGGIGHMCDNDTAAYDPIFYLHHCNVDRLLAFWEHIYPNYVAGTEGYLDVDGVTRNPFTQVDGTFIEMGTQSVDGETPLMPFRKSDYTYWTSKDTHSLHDDQENPTVNKYYTYGPIAGVELELDPKKAPNEKKRERQRAAIQKYFGFDPVKAVKDAEVTVKQRIFAQQAPFGAPAPTLAGRIIQVVDNYRHFVIATSLSQSHITGSYMLKIYMAIGEQEFHVGSVAALGRGKSTGCGNCQARRAAGTRVQGVVTLPHAAIAGLLQTLVHHTEKTEDQEVLISIKGSIRARIVLPSGKVHSEPTGQVSNSSGLDFLEKEARPSLRLYSSDVYQTYEEGQQPEASESSEAPFNFQDWKDHDSIVLGHWVKKEVD